MSLSIGTSAPSSARETHAAWLRLRGDCQQFLDYVPDSADHGEPEQDRPAAVENRDALTQAERGSGGNVLV